MPKKYEEKKVIINYAPHKRQYEIHIDPHRYRVVCASRRFGKSILARQEIIRRSLTWVQDKKIIAGGIARTPRFWIVSPTFKQGRQNHWNEMKQEIPLELIAKKQGKYRINETELEIELINGVIISIKGADNPDGLRGAGLAGVVMDECAFMKPEIWTQIIQPMLIDTNGWALFISTPFGLQNWFYTIYQQGLENSATFVKDWKSWHFTYRDNPLFDENQLLEIEKQKNILSEEEFRQEFEADFVTFKDLIYKDFVFEKHVIEPFDLDPSKYTFYRSIDFGFKHATGCLWIAVDKEDKWYIFDEYKQAEVSSEQNAGVIKSLHPEFTYEATFGDPSAAQLIEDYDRLGVYITPASKSMKTSLTQWVNLGISKVTEKLKLKPDKDGNMVPDLYIFNTCEKLIEEIQGYRWKEQPDSTKAISGQPVKIKDDLCFARGTLINTNTGRVPIEKIKIGDKVLTPVGYSKVINSRCTGIKKTIDYGWFRCTPEHKIITDKGIIPISKMTNKEKIMIYLGHSSDFAPKTNLEKIFKNGIYKRLLEIQKNKGIFTKIKIFIQCILGFLNIEPMIAMESNFLINKTNKSKKEKVYSLTTDKGMYFAENILVSNCDPLRYAAISITEPFSQSGDNYNFPKEELFPTGMYI